MLPATNVAAAGRLVGDLNPGQLADDLMSGSIVASVAAVSGPSCRS